MASKGGESKKKGPGMVHFAAGGIGGMLGAIITCPLEVVKTRLQSSYYSHSIALPSSSNNLPRPISTSPLRALSSIFLQPLSLVAHIYRHEGITALWKGLGPNLVGIIPSRGIHFGTYSHMKAFLKEKNGGSENSLIHLTSAAVAGITVATVTCPIWVVKTRMQLQESGKEGKRYKNSLDCLKKMIREEGGRSLYRGLAASYLGVIEGTIQFVLYEKTKRIVMDHRKTQDPSSQSSYQEWLDYFTIAAASKLAASILTYPHEVVRTRLREPPLPGQEPKYKGLVKASTLIFKEEGFIAFYGGVGAHLLRVVPNAAIMFLGYEFVVKMFE